MLVDFSHNFTTATGTTTKYSGGIPHGFTVADRNIIRSDNYERRLQNAFSRTPYRLSLHVLDGLTDPEALFPFIRNKDVIYNHQLVTTIKRRPDVITVVYTNNVSGNNIPLTPWILAHRMFHAPAFSMGSVPMSPMLSDLNEMFKHKTFNNKIYEIFNLIFDPAPVEWYRPSPSSSLTSIVGPRWTVIKLFIELQTMKSARSKNQNSSDTALELITQYIITGSVKLKRFDDINFDKFGQIHPNYSGQVKNRIAANSSISDLEIIINDMCKSTLDSFVGKKLIF